MPPITILAFENIDTFVAAGRKSGALGVMNTIWSDDVQMLKRPAWPGIAYGAAASWQQKPMDRQHFFPAYAAREYPPAAAASVASALRQMADSETALQVVLGQDTMLALWRSPFAPKTLARATAHAADLRRSRLLAEGAEEDWLRAIEQGADAASALSYLVECRLLDYAGLKFQYGVEITQQWKLLGSHPDPRRLGNDFDNIVVSQQHGKLPDLMETITELKPQYEQAWLEEYTPYRLAAALGRWDAEYEYWRRLQANCFTCSKTTTQPVGYLPSTVFCPPDFLSRLVALANFNAPFFTERRTCALSSAAWQEIRVRGGDHRKKKSQRDKHLIEALVYQQGPISRVGIHALTNLRRSTISLLTRQLLTEGKLIEAGPSDNPLGRKQILLELNRKFGFLVGVEFDDERVTAGVMDLQPSVTRVISEATDLSHGKEGLLRQLQSAVRRVVAASRLPWSKLLGIGIADPGLVDTRRGVTTSSSTIDFWNDVPVTAAFEKEFKVPVLVESKTRAKAIAEQMLGVGQREPNMIYLDYGTGIGAGVLVDGKLLYGHNCGVGEVGHTNMVRSGPTCKCGSNGCLEAVAGAGAVENRTRKALSEGSLLAPSRHGAGGFLADHGMAGLGSSQGWR